MTKLKAPVCVVIKRGPKTGVVLVWPLPRPPAPALGLMFAPALPATPARTPQRKGLIHVTRPHE